MSLPVPVSAASPAPRLASAFVESNFTAKLSPSFELAIISTTVKPDFTHNVLIPLRAAQAVEAAKVAKILSDCNAIGGTVSASVCVPPPPPAPVEPSVVTTSLAASTWVTDSLYGSYGYSLGYGNCVNEPGVNNPGWGNPIDWGVLAHTPSIGASVLFYFNHVAVVSGIWSNGDIEIRQQNAPGMPHRIPRSMIRGFR